LYAYLHNLHTLIIDVCLQCLLYRTEHAQDVKKIEKFTGLLMRHMASKDTKWIPVE